LEKEVKEKLYWIAYSSIYNRRPGEGYGMGNESLNVYGNGKETLEDFMSRLVENSSIKHKTSTEYIYGTDIPVPRPDWISYIGQPAFFVTDVRFRENKGEDNNPFLEEDIQKTNG
jgi:hypothetical protein